MIGPRVYQRGRILLDQFDQVKDDPDPVNKLGRGVWLAGQVAWGVSQLDGSKLPAQEQSAPAGTLQRSTCGYCRTLCLLSQSPRCPNCGAPARG
jgi:hypothetical protein